MEQAWCRHEIGRTESLHTFLHWHNLLIHADLHARHEIWTTEACPFKLEDFSRPMSLCLTMVIMVQHVKTLLH